MTTIPCIRCGDPCLVTRNGAMCADCGIYAYPTDGRWKVYLPVWLVPCFPVPPKDWHLIAPADAVPGDGVLLPGGIVTVLDDRMFGAFPIDERRKSWAVRR